METKEELKEAEEKINKFARAMESFGDTIEAVVDIIPESMNFWDYPKSKKKRKENWKNAKKYLKEKYPNLNKEFDDLEDLAKAMYWRTDEIYNDFDEAKYKAKELADISEEYERKMKRALGDLTLVKLKMPYEKEKELEKGLARWGGLEVDHMIPIAIGGDEWDEKNLRTLCHACHLVKTKADRKAISAYKKKVEGQKTMTDVIK